MEGERATAEATDLVGRLLAGVLVAARDDDVGAGLGERMDDRASEPTRAAGDEGDATGEVEAIVGRCYSVLLVGPDWLTRLPPRQ
jgi:hypothetical protein